MNCKLHISLSVLIMLNLIDFSSLRAQELLCPSINMFTETVWLETDRYHYLSGENIRFRASLLEKDTYKPSVLSKNIRIELIDPEGQPMARRNIELAGSLTSGNILIPADVETGWYRLRAYTNWMRNFSVSGFSVLDVKIVNPVDLKPVSENEQTTSIRVNLYPAGGYLVPGYANECGIFTSDGRETPLPVSGYIIDDLKDTLAEFQSDRTGWDLCRFIPQSDRNYEAIVDGYLTEQVSSDRLITKEEAILVEVAEDGGQICVQLNNLRPGLYKDISILLHRTGSLYWHEKRTAYSAGMEIMIPEKEIPKGIVQVTVLGGDTIILAARLWSDYHPDGKTIKLQPERTALAIRGSSGIGYHTGFIAGDHGNTSLNALVALKEPGIPQAEYMPGLPGWSLHSQIPIDRMAFLGWLAAHKYPDELIKGFAKPIPGSSPAYMTYLPETRAGILTGRVSSKNSGNGIPGASLGVMVFNDNSFQATRTDSSGQFYFAFPGIYNTHDFILNFITEPQPEWQIAAQSVYDERPCRPETRVFTLTGEELDYYRRISITRQLKNIYAPQDSTIKSLQTDRPVHRDVFFSPPDKTVYIDEFIGLSDVREVVYELVPDVYVKNRDGKSFLSVYFTNRYAEDYETLILIDGIPATSHNQLLDLPADRIRAIQVKNKVFIQGKHIFSGIVNFISRNGDYAGLELPANALLSSIDLPVKGDSPYMPAPIDNSGPIPVLERTLLWQHNLKFNDGYLEFNANDITGDFTIYIYGFDGRGEWHWGSTVISIGTKK